MSNMLTVNIYLQIGGIGKVTEHILRDVFGISTCEEMLQNGGFLYALFSQSSAGQYSGIAFLLFFSLVF